MEAHSSSIRDDHYSIQEGSNAIRGSGNAGGFRPQSAKYGDIKGRRPLISRPTLIASAMDQGGANRSMGPSFSSATRGAPMLLNNFIVPVQKAALFSRSQAPRQATCPRVHDKEQLYDEAVKLQQHMTAYREENLRLRTMASQFESDLEQKDKAIQDLLSQMNPPKNALRLSGPRGETHLVAALKRQIKGSKEEIRAKENRMKELEKNVKITKWREMEVEEQMCNEEIGRLKAMLQEIVSQKMGGYSEDEVSRMEESIYQQNILLSSMREENGRLGGSLQKKEEELGKLREALTELQNKAGKYKTEHGDNLRNKRHIKEIARETQQLREQLNHLKSGPKDKQLVEFQNRINQLLKKQTELNEGLEQKTKMAHELENKTAADKAKKAATESEYKELRGKIGQYEEELGRLRKDKRKVLPMVAREEVEKAGWVIKLGLIRRGIPFGDLRKDVFGVYGDNDMISIYELSRTFARRPECASLDTARLARYLIEPTGAPSIEFDQLAEERIFVVVERLSLLLGEYPVLDEQKELALKQALADKFAPHIGKLKKAFQEVETGSGRVELAAIGEVAKRLDLELTADEAIYAIFAMYRKDHNIDQLDYESLISLLKPLCHLKADNKTGEEEEYAKEGFEELKGSAEIKASNEYGSNGGEYEEKFEAEQEENAKAEALEEGNPGGNENAEEREKEAAPTSTREEVVDINEDQMIEIAQNCFKAIAERMIEKKVTIKSVYQGKIYKEEVNGEEAELLSAEDFLRGLRQMGIEDLEEVEQACLIKVLAISDDDKVIRVADLAQILEDYGIREKSPAKPQAQAPEQDQPEPDQEQEKEEDKKVPETAGLNFDELDKVSMVLMLALTEYLIKANVPLYELLGEAVYKQAVRTKTKEKSVDVINSKDFFEVLHRIGIKTEDSEHENLRNFLALSASHQEKIHVKKLKKAIEQFAVNEQLRAHAHDCYMELVGSEDGDGGDPEAGEPEGNEGEEPAQEEDVEVEGEGAGNTL